MKYSLSLGTIFGIKVQIHWSFLILLGWIVMKNMRSGSGTEQTLWSVLFILTIFLCVTMHEFGHALAARKFGIKTKDITLLPIGGLARLERIPEKPKEELIVALAGPLVNVVIVAVIYPFVHFTMDIANVKQLESITSDNFIFNLMVINLWLAIFNLIPAFPMDGGRVLRALLAMKMQRHKATEIAVRIGQLAAVGFVILGIFSNPFLIFIGLFIIMGAQAELEMTKSGFMLKGIILKDVVMKNYESIDENETIETAVNKLLNGQSKNFLVTKNQQPIGTLSRDEIIEALQTGGNKLPIHNAMNKDLIAFDANQPIDTIYQAMVISKNQFATVYENKILIGTVDLENILEYLMVKNAQTK